MIMIKLISLDAWNTMLRLDLITRAIAWKIGEQIGLNGELVLKIMISVYRELKPKWISGLIEDSTMVEEAQHALAKKLHLTREVVSNAIMDAFEAVDPLELVYHDVWEALEDLSREFKLAVISNVFYWPGRLTRRIIEGAGLSRLLKAQLYADELGISKPDRRIFLKLCRMLGVSSWEAVHVGDELMEDIGGALSSGMRAILVRRNVENTLVIRELNLAIIPRLSDLRHVLSELQ